MKQVFSILFFLVISVISFSAQETRFKVNKVSDTINFNTYEGKLVETCYTYYTMLHYKLTSCGLKAVIQKYLL